MPAFLVGVTVVAVGTSLPELMSSVLAVVEGAPEMVSGNVVGSNIANLLLVLGLAAVIDGHIRLKFELVNVDLPFLAGSAFLLALVLWDGRVSVPEALLSLAALGIYLWYAACGRQPTEGEVTEKPRERPAWVRIGMVLVGSAVLIYFGADYTVLAAVEIAGHLGMGPELIAATVIALGTSLPEVAVTLTAARRGQTELAVGNVLGSNVFNSFAVIGVAGLVGPLPVPDSIIDFALPVMVIATVLTFFTIMEKEMTKWEGWLMILFYVYFIGAVLNLM